MPAGSTSQFYTYLIGWSFLDLFYYGSRTSKNANPKELMISYKTSSTVVKRLISIYGIPDIIKIRRTFSDKVKCYNWECKVLQRIDARNHSKFLNQHNNEGLNPVKSGQNLTNRNFFVAKDCYGNVFMIHRNDPRYISGELIHVTKGTVSVEMPNGDIIRISKDDPRYISGELKFPNRCFKSGPENAFFGKSHTDESMRKAVETRLRNSNGVYHKTPITISQEAKERMSMQMHLNNPMYDADIKMKSSCKRVKTIKTFEYWYKTHFKKILSSMYVDVESYVINNISTIKPVNLMKTFGLKEDFSRSIISRFKQKFVNVELKEELLCQQQLD